MKLSDRYQLLERIGSGGFGSVYRARHKTLDQEVAVKLLGATEKAQSEAGTRFMREARNAAKLRHPNNVRVFDFGESDEGLFIAMELVDGQPLSALQRPMPVERACRLGSQIAAALSEAHSIGLIHRDVKPDNILVTSVNGEDFAKVLDYGISKLESGDANLTHSGAFIGTPAYAAPEQITSSEVDRRADLYSLGLILYELLAGRAPFEADTPIGLLFKQVHEVPAPITTRVELPPRLANLIDKLLRKNRDERPKSMDEVRLILDDLGRTLSGSKSISVDLRTRTLPSSLVLAQSPTRVMARAAAVVGAIVVAGAAATTAVLMRGGPESAPTADAPPYTAPPNQLQASPTGPEADTDPAVTLARAQIAAAGVQRSAAEFAQAESSRGQRGDQSAPVSRTALREQDPALASAVSAQEERASDCLAEDLEVTVRIRIDANGVIQSVTPVGDALSASAECIRQRLLGAQLPAPRSGEPLVADLSLKKASPSEATARPSRPREATAAPPPAVSPEPTAPGPDPAESRRARLARELGAIEGAPNDQGPSALDELESQLRNRLNE